jgi:probable rRNA maturation factor
MAIVDISGSFAAQVNASLIKRTVHSTLATLSIPDDTSLSIVITDDQNIQELNLKYREINKPTDVLSFPAGHVDPESGTTYIGDVIISYPQAVIQAEQRGHPVDNELQLLVIHGTLHLLGLDHVESAQKKRMWAVQEDILNQLGIVIHSVDGG